MTPEHVINYYGTQTEAGRQLGLAQSTVAEWKQRGRIPYLRQLDIERVTKGKLKAESRPKGKM
jgi:DNA-binding transcriptional regulator YdaS (Cro superfamily)